MLSLLPLLLVAGPAEVSPDWWLVDGFDRLPATVLRTSELRLRDPHLFAQVFPGQFGCLDITDSGLNAQLQTALTSDGDGDGLVDSSPLLIFRPLDRSGAIRQLTQAEGQCSFPLAGTQCTLAPGADPPPGNYAAYETGDNCLAPLAGTTGGYSPAVLTATAPCFTTAAADGSLAAGSVPLELRAGRAAGSFVGNPVTAINNGLLRGFLSEAAANALILPATLPAPLGGQPLSKFLRGGAGSCASGDDRDVHEGVTGWWFYLNYSAGLVPFTEPAAAR